MKILVTGGAGFIGSHLTEELLRRGHQVTVLDDLSNGHLSFLNEAQRHGSYRFVEGSVLDESVVASLVKDHDAVFHLAAMLGVKKCMEDPLGIMESSIFGTYNVARACAKWNRKLVFTSTSEVYGKNIELPFVEEADRVLGATTVQRWSYATAKATDEHLCFAYAQHGLRVTVLRYFNIYGPRSVATPYAGVIPKMIERAIVNEPVLVHADGTQTRCFTFIGDAVTATVNALSARADGMVINVGTTDEIPIRDLAIKIIQLTGSASSVAFVPYEVVFGPGYEDSHRRVPDLTRQKEILQSEPTTTLTEGLIETIHWHEFESPANPKGVQVWREKA